SCPADLFALPFPPADPATARVRAVVPHCRLRVDVFSAGYPAQKGADNRVFGARRRCDLDSVYVGLLLLRPELLGHVVRQSGEPAAHDRVQLSILPGSQATTADR